MDSSILSIVLWAIPVVLAITLHEAAHGYVARMFGDPTAHEAGRITLNPLKHIDPVGTILLPGMILATNAITGGSLPVFGWAKPVPVNFNRLRNPKKDMFWVAGAGPASNLAQAIIWACVASLATHSGQGGDQAGLLGSAMLAMAQAGMISNIVLMLLNLLPVPPLDGGRIMVSLLPVRYAVGLMRMEPFGFPILIALLFLGVLDRILWPLIPVFYNLLNTLTGA